MIMIMIEYSVEAQPVYPIKIHIIKKLNLKVDKYYDYDILIMRVMRLLPSTVHFIQTNKDQYFKWFIVFFTNKGIHFTI